MNRYILIFIVLLFFTAQSAYAQKIRFTDTTNIWKLQYSSGWPLINNYENRYFDGYVTKNNTTYTNIKYIGLCREDTALKKVFVTTFADTTEDVLYDYNLEIGDTFTYRFLQQHEPPAGVVTKIDSIAINAVYHKIWKLENLPPYLYNATLVEGIGLLIWSTFEHSRSTVCFHNKGNMITVDQYISQSTCMLAVNDKNNLQNTPICPNPANRHSVISFPFPIQSGNLTITDMSGKILSRKSINNQSEITIGDLPANGLYFFQLTDIHTTTPYYGKFIYE